MTAWHENDDLFLGELTVGHGWAEKVANALKEEQIKCHIKPVDFRKNYRDRKRFENEQDIIFDTMPGCIEVKSRRLAFGSDPSSYPYKTAFVDTRNGWVKKKPKPVAVVLVSQQTGNMLVIPVSTSGRWGTQISFDRVRSIEESWFVVDKRLLRTFGSLTDWLIDRQLRYGQS